MMKAPCRLLASNNCDNPGQQSGMPAIVQTRRVLRHELLREGNQDVARRLSWLIQNSFEVAKAWTVLEEQCAKFFLPDDCH